MRRLALKFQKLFLNQDIADEYLSPKAKDYNCISLLKPTASKPFFEPLQTLFLHQILVFLKDILTTMHNHE